LLLILIKISRETAPGVLAKDLELFSGRDMSQRVQSDRTQVDVARNNSKISFLFDKNTLVSSLVEMPHTFVLTIKEAGIGDIEVTHEFGEIAKRSFHQQMEMVRHQDIGMELDRVDVE